METIAPFFNSIAEVFPGIFLAPEKRLFWPFLLSALVITLLVVGWQRGLRKACAELATLVSPGLWFNRSSVQDVSWLFFNSLIRSWVLLPLLGTRLAAAMAVALFFQQSFGDSSLAGISRASAWNAGALLILFSLSFFLLEDLSRFGLHQLMHKVPLLWKFHSVHHSAETMTPLTLHRVHSVEMALYQIRSLLVFAVMAGGYTWLFQSPANVWQIMGVNALGFIFNGLAANLRHSHVWLSFGRFERWFISPAQHQIHHSSAESDQNLNYGSFLTIWDRLFGTYRAAGVTPRPLVFGLTRQESSIYTYR